MFKINEERHHLVNVNLNKAKTKALADMMQEGEDFI